jgi:hypothetical protein
MTGPGSGSGSGDGSRAEPASEAQRAIAGIPPPLRLIRRMASLARPVRQEDVDPWVSHGPSQSRSARFCAAVLPVHGRPRQAPRLSRPLYSAAKRRAGVKNERKAVASRPPSASLFRAGKPESLFASALCLKSRRPAKPVKLYRRVRCGPALGSGDDRRERTCYLTPSPAGLPVVPR